MTAHAPHIAPRQRLVARLRTASLDTALASGVAAETDSALALRARRLTKPPTRRKLSLAIRRLVDEADGDGAVSHVRVSAVSGRVTAASRELTTLAENLAEPAPVCARGVAQALLLLTDGTGPLYNSHNGGSVRESAATALANLRPAS
jgi:hypothetical protein